MGELRSMKTRRMVTMQKDKSEVGRSVEKITGPGRLLRLEGATMLLLSVLFYGAYGGNWFLFVVLLLAPDLSALGYLAGTSVGSATYNLAHTYLLPALLAAFGVFGPSS